MRRNHFNDISLKIDVINDILNCVSKNGISDWNLHYEEKIKPIKGLGPSTYTKFLYFMKASIEGQQALILDKQLIEVFKKNLFKEFNNLKSISESKQISMYVCYLKAMEKIGIDLGKLELFLFMFGKNLKI